MITTPGNDDRTDEYCAADPHAAEIRKALLDLERKAHATGWDGPDSRPRIFALHLHKDRPQVRVQWADQFNSQLKAIAEANGGNIGSAIEHIAEIADTCAQYMRSGSVPDRLAATLPQSVVDLMAEARERGMFDGDLMGDGDYRFHGYGIRTEAWGARATAEDADAVHRAAEQRAIHRRPDRIELRYVLLPARDGILWIVERARGQRQASSTIALPESSTSGFAGQIVHGLSRMSNAVAANPVPIWPADNDRWRNRRDCNRNAPTNG